MFDLFSYDMFRAMVSIGIDTMRSPCSALNVKVVRNSKQAGVNGGRSHDSLKVASALEIHISVAPLRDDLANIYALPFRFLGTASGWR